VTADALLEISDLSVRARSRTGETEAVRGLDLGVGRGEALGIIGESGSGKSTTVAALLDLLGPNRRIVSGTMRFDRQLVYGPGVDLRPTLRGRKVGFVFQAAAASLNPMRRVRSQFAELLGIHLGVSGDAAGRRMHVLLEHLGFDDPRTVLRSYPHQLSGGMAQRVAIAMALAGEPSLLVADEVTSAVDVITQASVVALLRRLVSEDGYALVFVTHDIALAAEICDSLLVLRDGRVVEAGTVEMVVRTPQSDYTRELIGNVPLLDRSSPPLAASTIGGTQPTTTARVQPSP